MAQVKDKVSQFFQWARKGKTPVSVDATRVDEDGNALPANTQGKEVSIQQLKNGYGEVVDTMKAVRSHLEEQSGRSDQMLELMRGLPEVLKSIPESNRNQARMLEAIHDNLAQQNETSGQLSNAITGLTSAAAQQERALSQIRDHLSAEDETRHQLNQGIDSLNGTLGHVMDSNSATRDTMSAILDHSKTSDEHTREMFKRSQKLNTMMMFLCLALTVGALALAGYMAVMVSRMAN